MHTDCLYSRAARAVHACTTRFRASAVPPKFAKKLCAHGRGGRRARGRDTSAGDYECAPERTGWRVLLSFESKGWFGLFLCAGFLVSLDGDVDGVPGKYIQYGSSRALFYGPIWLPDFPGVQQ